MKNTDNESKNIVLPDVVEKAIEILNSPSDRENPEADRERRLAALQAIVDSRVVYSRSEFLKRIGASKPSPLSSPSTYGEKGHSGSTNPILTTSNGTGLFNQAKSPRDLRDRDKE